MGLDDELRFHLEEQTRLNIAKGMSPAEAEREARASLGSVAAIRDDVRDVHPWAWADGLRQDLAYAVRTLRKSPGFTITAVLSLALGIGVNTAVFSAIREIVLRQLPVREPARLVRLEASFQDWSYPIMADFAKAQKVFSEVFGSYVNEVRVREGARDLGPMRVSFTTPDYFAGLAPELALGRAYGASESRDYVAVIQFEIWDREFQRDPQVLGRTLQIGAQKFQIVGVTAPSFFGENPTQRATVWVPFGTSTSATPRSDVSFDDRRFHALTPMARLRPGVSLTEASANAKAILPHIMELNDLALNRPHKPFPGLGIDVLPGQAGIEDLRKRYSKPLYLLQGAVILVLAIACFNLANLLYVRGLARQREIAVRLAMGSHRGRLVRQLLLEGVVLSAVGSVPALAIAAVTLRILSPFLFSEDTPPISMDWTVLVLSLLVAAAAGIAASVRPALRATNVDLNAALKGAAKTATTDRQGRRSARTLVALQVAFSFTLAVASTMLLHNLQRIYAFDLGYDRDNLLLTEFNGSGLGLLTPESQAAFHDRTLASIRAIPGVQSASLSHCGLLTGCGWGSRITIDGKTLDPSIRPTTNLILATHSFSQTIGFQLMDGRLLEERDNKASAPVVLVNQSFADKFLPGERAVGRVLRSEVLRQKQATIVGVLRDAVYISANRPNMPMVFVPYAQEPANVGSLEVRVAPGIDPGPVAVAILRTLSAADDRERSTNDQ
jgi:predicted permease